MLTPGRIIEVHNYKGFSNFFYTCETCFKPVKLFVRPPNGPFQAVGEGGGGSSEPPNPPPPQPMGLRYPSTIRVILRSLVLPSRSYTFFFDTTNLYEPLRRFAVFLAYPKSPDLRTEVKCPKLPPEAFCEILP